MFIVSFLSGKRLETIPVKFNEAEKQEIKRISETEERPMGYVVRTLMLRGLREYWKDKKLKIDISEFEEVAAKELANKPSLILADDLGSLDDDTVALKKKVG